MSDRHITFDIILRSVCAVSGMSRQEMMRDTRTEPHLRMRFAAWWLASRLTPLSLSAIGRLAGDRDHTSIISGIARCDVWRADDPDYRAQTDAMLATLTALERSGLLALARELDPVGAARRVIAAPEREAVRVSTYEIVAMASLIVGQFGESDEPTPDPFSAANPPPIEEIDHAA
jgi:hypothetical protein